MDKRGSSIFLIDSKHNPKERWSEAKLPLRDWFLLPLLAVATIASLAVPAELVSRRLYHDTQTALLSCLVMNDPSTGVRGIPNCSCTGNILESTPVEIRFNSCGHRAGMECGPKPEGVYRIVLVGSSFGEGLWVPREQTFAALLPAELSRRTGRRIELYNESMQWGTPHSVDLRFNEAIAAKPDMILWTMTPWDIDNVDVTIPDAANMPPSYQQALAARASVNSSRANPSMAGEEPLFPLHLAFALYKSRYQYMNASLRNAQETEYLRVDQSARWNQRMLRFDAYLADISARAGQAGIPLVVTVLPLRAQSIMISTGEWQPEFDPYKFGNEVRAAAESHGASYADVLAGFRNVSNPDQDYYPVDGHINKSGHKVVSDLLSDALVVPLTDVLKVTRRD